MAVRLRFIRKFSCCAVGMTLKALPLNRMPQRPKGLRAGSDRRNTLKKECPITSEGLGGAAHTPALSEDAFSVSFFNRSSVQKVCRYNEL